MLHQCTQFRGRMHKVFPITAFGAKHNVVVDALNYRDDNTLAICVYEMLPDEHFEPWGVLTVNMSSSLANDTRAFVKSYSENEEWADDLARQIGGKKTNISKQAGFCTVSLWDFSNLVI